MTGGIPYIEDNGRDGTLFTRGVVTIDRASDAGAWADALAWRDLFLNSHNDRCRDNPDGFGPATALIDPLHTTTTTDEGGDNHAT